METARARAIFSAERVARLATAGADGVPHLVPVTFAVTGDRIVTAVDHKPKRTTDLRRLRNIRENPRVTLLADRYDDDWTRLWWVRADGTAAVIEERSARERLIGDLTAKYSQYRERPPDGPVIVVSVSRWSGWSYAGRPGA